MAGKATSVYLTVVVRATQKSVFRKKFFEAKAYRDFVKDKEFCDKYPLETYQYIKEVY